MFFSLTELEHHPILFDVAYQPGEIAFGDDLQQNGPLTAKGKAELLRNTQGEIRIRGEVEAHLIARCDRCLADAAVEVGGPFDLFYRPIVPVEAHGEVHLEEGEIDLSFYEGEGVALREALREHVLLNLPMRVICREDCKGLCPVCGADLNQERCSCQPAGGRGRLAELRSLD